MCLTFSRAPSRFSDEPAVFLVLLLAEVGKNVIACEGHQRSTHHWRTVITPDTMTTSPAMTRMGSIIAAPGLWAGHPSPRHRASRAPRVGRVTRRARAHRRAARLG